MDGSENIPNAADAIRAASGEGGPPLNVAVGLGDPARERALLLSLNGSGDITVVARCLSADQVIARARDGDVAAVLVAFDLHRLTSDSLVTLAQTGIALVVLAPDERALPWPYRETCPGLVVPLDAAPETIRAALWAAVRGERHAFGPPVPARRDFPHPSADAPPLPTTAGSVLAIASGPGSPGRTTVALNLAVALGAVAPTVLVDVDLAGPSIAAHLDLDPTRNLAMLAHADPSTPAAWDRALAEELQPLTGRSPRGVVLCGLPKLELRTTVSRDFFERLITVLRQRYRYVVCDQGADLLGSDLSLHRVTLGLADRILLVAAADLLGLWRARAGLDLLRSQLHVSPEHLALVINRHQPRHHHPRSEIEWAFGMPASAVIPDDPVGAARAMAVQQPLALDSRSRAGRTLVDLASRVHAGAITLPPELHAERRRGWPPWLPLRRFLRPRRSGVLQTEEVRTP